MLTALLAFGVCVLLPNAALADVWLDIDDATWQSAYGVSAEEAVVVAQGRSDGTFGPGESVNRAQFAKMTTSGLELSPSAPETPTFCDVPTSHDFYDRVEGCAAAGLISGYSDGSFRPNMTVTRQQTSSILGHWLAEQELAAQGGIVGIGGTYASLTAWYRAEGGSYLAAFADAQSISPAHQITSAYLVCRGVMMGSSSEASVYLRPTAAVNRAQAVALVLRVKQVAAIISRPVVTPVEPDGPTAIVLTQGQTPLRGVWSGTAERLASFLLDVAPSPCFSVPAEILAEYYVRYSAEAGLRADLLWAQMIHETGYGTYGGDVLPEQNNYAGIGATGGGVPGCSFPTAEAGVIAHVAHMVAYVYTESPVAWADATTDPRFDLVNPRGMAVVLADLNGRWAFPGTTYGQSIEALARAINAG